MGILLGAVLQGAGWYLLPGHLLLAIVFVLVMLIVITYGFELFSLVTGKGHYDFMDAVAGTIGGILGMIVILIIQYS